MLDTAFSARIKDLTSDDHRRASRSEFMRAFIGGRLDLAGYSALSAQLYFVYSALERATETMRTDPVAGRFVFPELARVPSLEADLRFLIGPNWTQRIAPTAATQRYLARMRKVCFSWPGGFIAHHYTRYLGDLSGGQIMCSALRRNYELPDGQGARFYVFDGVEDAKDFKARYRKMLDEAPWAGDERERVISEILAAYQHNIDMLEELGRELLPDLIQDGQEDVPVDGRGVAPQPGADAPDELLGAKH